MVDFRFTPEQQAWRSEVGAYLDSLIPAGYKGVALPTVPPDSAEDYAFARQVHKALAAKGWLVLSWPEEYGGKGLGVIDQLIFTEEYTYRRLPHLGPGVNFVGPSLMHHGSAEQKAAHLPPIASADAVWCQGFSEPGTGSDLAGLQTRAVLDGDDFVVNGSKIWTTNGHRADWCWLAVRTNPDVAKHKGISVLLVDMKTPGITIRPIHDLTGDHAFNQVYFDEVRVPRSNLIGALDGGWSVLTTTLDFERSSIAASAFARRTLEELVTYARTTLGLDGQPIGEDAVLASKLAQRAVEVQVARLLAYQTASVLASGRVPNREASLSKVFGGELLQRLSATSIDVIGPMAALPAVETESAFGRSAIDFNLHTISSTIAGGAGEIQRGIIATRGLGMPRS